MSPRLFYWYLLNIDKGLMLYEYLDIFFIFIWIIVLRSLFSFYYLIISDKNA